MSLDLVGASSFELIQQIFDGDDMTRICNRAVPHAVTGTSGTGDKD